MAWRLLAIAAATTMLGAAEAPKPAPPAAPKPYLGDAAPDTYKILPPAPAAGTTRYEADRTVFLSTRRFKDTPRWALARGDDNSAGILKDLSCAVAWS